MAEAGSLIAVIVSAASFCALFRPKGWVFTLVSFWVAACFTVVMTGYIASALNQFGDIRWWLIFQWIPVFPLVVAAKMHGHLSLPVPAFRTQWKRFLKLNRYRKTLLVAPLITGAFLGIANGIVVWFCTPHQWDSLTYHLPRVAYYLQYGNLDPFAANYWAQTMHPKVSSVLQAWIFLVSGRNENLFQLLQFVSYWVAMLAIYGVCRRLFARRGPALFAALTFGLLVEVLLQATTPNNDLFLTALIACILLSLVAFRRSTDWTALIPGALAAGLAAGTKASFAMVIPSLAVIAGWVFIPKGVKFLKDGTLRRRWPVRMGRAVLLALLASAVVLPAGYIDNIKLYGHPIGSESVRGHHTFKGRTFQYIAESAARNILRFGMDSLALECPYPTHWMPKIHDAIRCIPRQFIERAGIDLRQSHDSIYRFTYGKDCTAHEDISYWGITGFALAFPLWISVVFRRSQWVRFLPFAVSSVFFIFLQAWGGPYDPWRGRYFIQLAPFALPVLVLAWDARWKVVRGYIVAVVAFACFTAGSAVIFRPNRPFISILTGKHKNLSVFNKRRAEQITANIGGLYNILHYEQVVPADAVVGVRFPGNQNEYALFGEGLTRTVIPFPDGQDVSYTGRVDYVVYCGPDSGGSWIVRTVRPDQNAKSVFDSIQKELNDK